MKEIEFKKYLYKNFDINVSFYDLFLYIIEISKCEIHVSWNEYNNKILPLIIVICKRNRRSYYYQYFKKALNRIIELEKEGEK